MSLCKIILYKMAAELSYVFLHYIKMLQFECMKLFSIKNKNYCCRTSTQTPLQL